MIQSLLASQSRLQRNVICYHQSSFCALTSCWAEMKTWMSSDCSSSVYILFHLSEDVLMLCHSMQSYHAEAQKEISHDKMKEMSIPCHDSGPCRELNGNPDAPNRIISTWCSMGWWTWWESVSWYYSLQSFSALIAFPFLTSVPVWVTSRLSKRQEADARKRLYLQRWKEAKKRGRYGCQIYADENYFSIRRWKCLASSNFNFVSYFTNLNWVRSCRHAEAAEGRTFDDNSLLDIPPYLSYLELSGAV